jgi:hypothetical protein
MISQSVLSVEEHLMPTDAVSSPVRRPIKDLAASPFLLARERENELRNLVDKYRITIEFVEDDDSLLLEVDPETGLIRFGLAFAERLWAYGFAYMEVIAKVQRSPPGADLELDKDPQTLPAIRLLAWAHACQVAGHQSPWPSDLPRPSTDAAPGSPVYAANEMFLCMGGWMLLHEIRHVVGEHHKRGAVTSPARHDLEYEADDWASHWILDQCPPDPRIRTKRALGAAFGLSIISSFEVHKREGAGWSHPDPLKRLSRFLDGHVPETSGSKAGPTDLVWWAAETVLILHLRSIGKVLPGREYADFRDVLTEAIKMIDAK